MNQFVPGMESCFPWDTEAITPCFSVCLVVKYSFHSFRSFEFMDSVHVFGVLSLAFKLYG